jgi:hypothetical protein
MSHLLLLTYLALVIIVLSLPYVTGMLSPRRAWQSTNNQWAVWLIVFCAVNLTIARGGLSMPLALILILPLLIQRNIPTIFGGLAAIALFSAVRWWAAEVPQSSTVQVVIFAALAGLLPFLPTWLAAPDRAYTQKALSLITALVFIPLGLFMGLLTAPLNSVQAASGLWHHWGAYLSPVEALLAGGTPFRDFPVQYGMGPTLLLSAACRENCWQGLYTVTVSANAIYFASLACCTLLVTQNMARGMRILGIAAMFCATLMWTGYPADFTGPAMTPSVGGLRFLTISLLLLHILYAEHSQKRRDIIGHAIWFVDVLWSPEAAFFGTLIWWPYLALRHGGALEKPMVAMTKGAIIGALALAVALCVGFILFRVSYGIWLPLDSLLAYISNPPGALPANAKGPIWIALVAVFIAMLILAQHQPTAQTRTLYAAVLGLLGTGTYYLSRSHDNNVLNLLPFVILTLFAAYAVIQSSAFPFAKFVGGFITIMLAAIVAGPATFGTMSWDEARRDGTVAQIGISPITARFTPKLSHRQPLLDHQAIVALTYLRTRTNRAVVFIDRHAQMPAHRPGAGWTSVNNRANFAPLPRPMIEHYIRQSAAVYKMPGWLLVENDGFGDWPVMFETAYRIGETKRFGGYTAYYMVPR